MLASTCFMPGLTCCRVMSCYVTVCYVIMLHLCLINVNELKKITIVTFCVIDRQHEMYIRHACLCVCLSVDLDVTWGNGKGCPLVVHYWADLQLVHGFPCCDNIA